MDSGEEEPAGTVSDVKFAPDLSPQSDSSSDSDAGDMGFAPEPAAQLQRGIELPSNHRGISLTCILSKVLEKIVHEQVTDYLAY